ncbi:MAG TPA: pyrroline-5-carboxylate reductase [Steroidobacteraceae bacterium]|nr:pyrroline-5-carboxylate reductase [Steroidobacteraceae bacterium]
MTIRRLCVLGAGNIGRALLSGLMRAGTRAEQLSVGEHLPAAREALARELGITAACDNEAATAGAEVVVLAVKPQEAQAVLAPLVPALAAARPLIISVLAGTRVMDLEAWCGSEVPVVRAMPNRPALLGAGISGMYAPLKVNAAQRSTAEAVLRAVGEVVWVATEDTLDVVTALSGSGPAYFFLLAELMAEAGQQLGLEHAVAQRLATVTLYGSGLLAHAEGAELARLRAEVTSRGGTTEAALRVFEGGGLRKLVAQALAAAAARGRELASASPRS